MLAEGSRSQRKGGNRSQSAVDGLIGKRPYWNVNVTLHSKPEMEAPGLGSRARKQCCMKRLRMGGKQGGKSSAAQKWGEKKGVFFPSPLRNGGKWWVLNVLDHLFHLLAPQAEIFCFLMVVYGLETRF